MKKVAAFIYKYRALFILALLLGYVGYIHGVNLTNYPYYESDEGTYTSQAWAVLTQGQLAPYTYWYDHPPVGWLTIAAWFSVLPDGYFTFGNSIDTARVLMLVLFLVNTTLVYQIVRKLTNSVLAATLAVIVFSSSPLIVYFSRRVLLDNIQTFWLLMSIYVLLPQQLSLRRYAMSGIFFALAFLTKITAVMFGLPILFLLLTLKDKTHKAFRTFSWLTFSFIVASLWFVYALIKNELLPPLFSWSQPHVSFWETLTFQMGRSNNLAFYEAGSDFFNAYNDWFIRDPLLVSIFLLTMVSGIVLFPFIKKSWYRFFVLMNIFFTIFLIRGGIVINFYFLPMVPHISISLALTLYEVMNVMNGFFLKYISILRKSVIAQSWRAAIMSLCIGFLLFHYNVQTDQTYLYADETKNQILPVRWVKENLPENTDIIIDSAMYVELHDAGYINDKVFENAEWFYKVSRDPQVRDDKYKDNWKNFDYLLLTHEMLKQIDDFQSDDIVREVFDNSLPQVKWFEDSTSFIDEQKRVTTNGDWSMLYDVNSETGVQLADAWKLYRDTFIHSYGQVIDPSNGFTTSEGQSYAMLRSVWMNDHDTFKGTWLWTQHHLQHRLEDKLISWKWADDALADATNATDADVDIALALIFASRNFGEEAYLEDARTIIDSIWEQAVIDIDGLYHLLPSNKAQAQVPEGLLFNPSYLSPAHFRIFASVDPEHDWNRVADDTYKILSRLTSQNNTPLIKNWYVVDSETGRYGDASLYVNGAANQFSYDAFRIFWRVWLDYAWFNNQKAEDYLTKTGKYLQSIVTAESIPTVINPVTGAYISTEDSLAIKASYVLPLTLSNDSDFARDYYESQIAAAYDDAGYWGSEEVYFDQNWVWFISAFYNHDLFNIWSIE